MPMYEYSCSACGIETEIRQRFSEDPIRICPNCGQETLERLISQSSFTLKGSGWYADGYTGGGSGGSAKASSTSSSSAPASTSSTSTTSTSSSAPSPSASPSSSAAA